jgi:hypothetical protein
MPLVARLHCVRWLFLPAIAPKPIPTSYWLFACITLHPVPYDSAVVVLLTLQDLLHHSLIEAVADGWFYTCQTSGTAFH